MSSLIRRFVADTSGATAIEYGVIAGLISVVIIVTVTAIGTRLNTKFTKAVIGLGSCANDREDQTSALERGC